MTGYKTIRITDVRKAADGKCLVTYYIGDRESQIEWHHEAPAIGDVFEVDAAKSDKIIRKLGSALPGAWTQDGDALRWRKPIAPGGISRMEVLRRRHVIRQAVRAYLDGEGFTEIDSPLVIRGASPDLALNSFSVGDHYLAASTEYQMKRLAMGGFEKIYSLTQNFRVGDTGTYRNPEFTMLEWGRVACPMTMIEEDAEKLTLHAIKKLGLSETITYQGHKIDMRRPWQRLSVAEAVTRVTGAPFDDFELASCRRAAEAAGIEIRPDWTEDRDFLFSLLMEHLRLQLGFDKPIFICDWPLYETTSAKVDEGRKTAERSELFIAGIEISDGFAGLANAELQQQFFDYALAKRKLMGKKPVALDHKYLAAMRAGAPDGAGMAMGFDRLVMLLTDQPHIANVLALGWDEL